ncbi:hypothetical protein PBI_DEWDROP_37 [Microbacterium phage Dewdrop]|nr:hypothetical protein PBI_LEAF_37 [Microbacterium phage Leaf]QGZ17406.1 hypothetical protein PBI_DEWDROP_37 [Microbacterium phage Dewdrop]
MVPVREMEDTRERVGSPRRPAPLLGLHERGGELPMLIRGRRYRNRGPELRAAEERREKRRREAWEAEKRAVAAKYR